MDRGEKGAKTHCFIHYYSQVNNITLTMISSSSLIQISNFVDINYYICLISSACPKSTVYDYIIKENNNKT